MPTYILLVNWTDQGVRNAKESPKRLDAAREMARKFGAELKDTYLTMGSYDLVSVLEAPDDQAVAKFVLSAGALGSIRTTTLKAFTEAEYRDIMRTLG
ncbi:MAG TPA: GYD domain-containing protein [Geminicoccaceae bacterium]|nr:GYD domain-containing protein [Geminicoccaceae bacterium]